MEWARQRFRLAFDPSDSGSNVNNKKLRRLAWNQSSVILLVVTTSVCLLPCVVFSAAEVSGSPGSINSVNFNSDDHKSQPSGAQIWRSIRQAGVVKRDGIPTPDEESSSGSSPGLHDFGNETESLTTLRTKRPILHRKAHPDLTSRKDSLKDRNEEDEKFNKKLKSELPHGHGSGHEGESKIDEEMQKIQSILSNIFFDEFQSEEELEEEDTEESENALTHDHLSRSSNNDFRNKSQVSLSRRARSEPADPLPDVRARHKIHNKAPRISSRDSESDNSSSGGKRGSSGSTGRQKKKPSKGASKGSDLTKYNEYMDSVFRRMNTMIKSKKMDPLRVNLYAGASNNPSKGGGGAGGKKGPKKNSPRMNLDSTEDEQDEETELDEDDDDLENGPARRDIFLNISHHDDQDPESTRKIRALLESVENSTTPETSDSPRGTSSSDSKPKKPKQPSNNREKNGNKSTKGQGASGNPGGNKKGNKASGGGNKGSKNKKNNKNTRPTRGILHGLSTLKRDGNVAVIKQGEQARIVRANFLLGPVSLEIMPKKGKASEGGKPVAATATASKLKGVLEVRLKKGSPTRIRRLRVYPPKNVKVEGTEQSLKGTKGKKPQQYGKVTPMATARLRQIASTVVRQADKSNKSPQIAI